MTGARSSRQARTAPRVSHRRRTPRAACTAVSGTGVPQRVVAAAMAFGGLSPAHVPAINALAARAILAMIADTMTPEAFETAHEFVGLISVCGFLTAFALSRWENA